MCWLGRNTETEKMLKCQHFPINTIASYMDPKISISVNIAKWHLGSTRGEIGGTVYTPLLGQVKHFGTALNTQNLHNTQMEPDMGGGAKRMGDATLSIAKSK